MCQDLGMCVSKAVCLRTGIPHWMVKEKNQNFASFIFNPLCGDLLFNAMTLVTVPRGKMGGCMDSWVDGSVDDWLGWWKDYG